MTTGDRLPDVADRSVPVAWLWMSLVTVVAALIATHVHGLAQTRPPGPDDSLYASEAVRWLIGRPLTTMSDDPASARGPAYVVALAVATAFGGDWQAAEPIVATASILVAVLAAATIAWSIAGPAAAALATGGFLVPAVIDAFARSSIDGLQAALVLSSVAIALTAAGRSGSWTASTAAVVGVGLGLAVLTKETALAVAPWPIVWAAGQPSAAIRRALRWAGIASAALLLTILPWWIWVYLTAGRLFPTNLDGLVAALGIGALCAAALLTIALAAEPVNRRLAGWLGRAGEGPRWGLAIAFSGVWAALVVAAFLAADARYALPRLPSSEEILEAVGRVLPMLLLPAAAIPVAVAAVAVAAQRSMLRGLLLVPLLTGGLGAIVVLKGWDPRSTLVPVVALGILLPIAAATTARILARAPSRNVRLAGLVALAAAVVGVTSLNYLGLVRAAENPPVTTEAQKWNGPVVRQAADWLTAHLDAGDSIVASWLFATSIDAMTAARYRIVDSPTLQVRVGGPGEPILVPTGTLFRESADLPPTPPNDWLFIRRHPTEGYLVALSARLLAEEVRQSTARFLVLTGEHPAQSTATIAASLVGWPGVREVARFAKDDAEIVILEIDQQAFSVGSFETQVNSALLRDWPDFVRAARRGVEAGTAMCEVLGGRDLEIVPVDDRGRRLLERLLPAGCPGQAGPTSAPPPP